MIGDIYRIEVRRNIVTRITAARPEEAPDGIDIDDPLAVSTQLADNNKANGCFDGDYYLSTFSAARHFAGLCLGFQKALCEKSFESVERAGEDGVQGWVNPFVPGEGGDE